MNIMNRAPSLGRGKVYHATFYDLQASNHLKILPNPPDFVAEELHHAFDCKADKLKSVKEI